MKHTLKRMWHSGLALLLTLCLVVGLFPTAAFAISPSSDPEKPTINYVSIGDSMANGYCFKGYHQDSNDRSVYDLKTGEGMYGEGAYPLQFEEYLKNQGYNVNHTKLATSAMLAEDLLYLLDGREEFDDGWKGFKDYIGTYNVETDLKPYFQEAITNADVITMGIGNASFGAFMLDRVTSAFGIFGASLDENKLLNFEDAIAVLDMDDEQYALVMQVYEMMESYLITAVPAEIVEEFNLDQVLDIVAYTAASYIVNYKLLVEKILEMNDDAEIVLVGLLNTTYGMNITDENGNVLVAFGDMVDKVFDLLNAYMAGLPTVLQEAGIAPEAKFYYAEQPNPKFICQEFANLMEVDWDNIQEGRLSGETVRERNITAFNDSLAAVIGNAVIGKPLTHITLKDVKAYEDLDWEDLAKNNGDSWNPWRAFDFSDYNHSNYADVILSVSIYLAIEEAVANSIDTLEIQLSGLLKIAGDLSTVFTALGNPPTEGPRQTQSWLLEGLSTEEIQGMCKIYGLFKVGNGMSVHPTPEGHDEIAKSVINAYANGHTAKDETIKNVKIALNDLYDLLETYGPDVAEQVWASLEEAGYIDYIETAIADLDDALTERYNNYVEVVIPTINNSIEELNTQAESLKSELAALQTELVTKKAELKAATGVAAEELADAVAQLEATIASVENAIDAVENNITDLKTLAAELTAAVDDLETQLTDLAAAAEDLGTAVEDLLDVLANAKNSTIEAVVSTYDAARDTVLAAAKVLENAVDAADVMINDIGEVAMLLNEKVVGLYDMVMEDLEEAYNNLTPEQKAMIAEIQNELEKAKAQVTAKLESELDALKAQYAPAIEAKKQELANLKQQIENEISKKYNEQKAAVDAKIADLTAQADALKAQLEEASAEMKAQIEAQIAAIEAQIATLKGDLETLKDTIRTEVELAHAKAVADLEKAIADLEKAYKKAVADVTAAADAKIKELVVAADKKLKELGEVGEAISATIADIYNQVQDEIFAVNTAIASILNGSVESVEDLVDAANALADETGKAIEAKVEELIEAIKEAFEAATTADLVIDDDFKYVAIGDGSAKTESYIEKLEALLNAEAAENGVDEIEVVNNAKVGNTVAAELANLSDVSDADLITIGFSNVTFLSNALQDKVTMDWAALIGEENVPYVDQLMAEVDAKIAEAGLNAEMTAYVSKLVEAYAYSVVEYAVELPALINEINAVNPDAVVIIVGMYNPMKGVSITLDKNTSLDIGEYVDYLVDGVAVHGIAYAMLTGNAIYVDARDVDTANEDTEITLTKLMTMAMNQFVTLYPNTDGHDYIAEQIMNALNITYVATEATVLLGDVNDDGVVDSRDLVRLQKYFAQIEGTVINEKNSDVNCDGEINSLDMVRLTKYFAQVDGTVLG